MQQGKSEAFSLTQLSTWVWFMACLCFLHWKTLTSMRESGQYDLRYNRKEVMERRDGEQVMGKKASRFLSCGTDKTTFTTLETPMWTSQEATQRIQDPRSSFRGPHLIDHKLGSLRSSLTISMATTSISIFISYSTCLSFLASSSPQTQYQQDWVLFLGSHSWILQCKASPSPLTAARCACQEVW